MFIVIKAIPAFTRKKKVMRFYNIMEIPVVPQQTPMTIPARTSVG